jgi:hypothetical protein
VLSGDSIERFEHLNICTCGTDRCMLTLTRTECCMSIRYRHKCWVLVDLKAVDQHCVCVGICAAGAFWLSVSIVQCSNKPQRIIAVSTTA